MRFEARTIFWWLFEPKRYVLLNHLVIEGLAQVQHPWTKKWVSITFPLIGPRIILSFLCVVNVHFDLYRHEAKE